MLFPWDSPEHYNAADYTVCLVKNILMSTKLGFMLLQDKNRTVGVYKFDCTEYVWNFIGKHRAHYKDITTLIFLPKLNPNGEYKLISMGLDRIMVEYDIGESSDEYLEVLSLDRMDQTAIPLAGIPWPMPKNLNPETHRTDLPLILIATDEVSIFIRFFS